jgi:hypothetical protein
MEFLSEEILFHFLIRGVKRGVEKTTKQGTLCFVLLTKYYVGDQIKKNEMGRTCNTCGGEQKCIQGFDGERPRHGWEDNIKMDLQDLGWGHELD